ncbi:MAG: NADH-quinone oxidoreductase subunit NuoE [Halanaerobiaceae bacterium]|jgi:NADH-quinone oxidoreductase subunit E/NADP-reducing hydrogenase subunit HndA|nr:NADH-quinone oxidoreductase subunit NuoE [Halanaerobiaceae bacterium]
MGCICGHDSESREKYLAPLKSILKKYEREERYLIPILQEAQGQYGYLPKDVLKEIASYLDLSLSQIYGVVTFYAQFHLKPKGRNVIRVCTGTACHVRGGAEVLKAIENELKIKSGGTTDDLEFTLETVACIGACGLAPVIMVNDDTHGRLTPDKVPAILQNYRAREKAAV